MINVLFNICEHNSVDKNNILLYTRVKVRTPIISGGSIWYHIYRWMGVSTVIPFSIGDHFNQFTTDGGVTKACRSILYVLWYATKWEIWKERNNKLFNDKECSIVHVVDKVKSLTFMWLKAKFPSLPFNYHSWWLNFFTMLGIC